MFTFVFISITLGDGLKKILLWFMSESVDGPGNYHTKGCKSERERQTSYDIAFMWNLKQWYEWIYLQKRNWVTD